MATSSKEAQEIKKITDRAGALLIKKKSTLAVAESVTAGNIQAMFSLAKNAIQFFQGGITAYNLGQKYRHLLVEPIDALQNNCVSKKVADQMASQVCQLFCADYGIGITGYASPVPEQNINKIFAHISIARNGKVISSQRVTARFSGPHEVQLFYTQKSIKMLSVVLNK